ncbi:PREDICTED: triple QxxK/R motif-containing protein-like [Priapulus caudatus]|uniref:Triple QxxK/R motif-containing protein n=1 Tax=Priapulus caudatus TaxID=37621 RepID=A0ABM1F162_PRICU|nr:PREDICTED: triple QxxK/R motif-containing protein-like [Priapulus caudatus]
MARADSTKAGPKASFNPVENYRKQIGKQDYKKSKKEIAEQKRRADIKDESGIKDVILLVGAVMVVFLAIYLLLYVFLSPSENK